MLWFILGLLLALNEDLHFYINTLWSFLLLQVVELQNRLSEESKKADKLEFEYKMLKEKVDSFQKEKDVCIQHINVAVPFYT